MTTAPTSTLDLVTVDEVAAMLGKSPGSIRWMIHNDQLPRSAKIGGRRMWRRSQIVAWVDAQFEASQPTSA